VRGEQVLGAGPVGARDLHQQVADGVGDVHVMVAAGAGLLSRLNNSADGGGSQACPFGGVRGPAERVDGGRGAVGPSLSFGPVL
jgi:hypothetical protein